WPGSRVMRRYSDMRTLRLLLSDVARMAVGVGVCVAPRGVALRWEIAGRVEGDAVLAEGRGEGRERSDRARRRRAVHRGDLDARVPEGQLRGPLGSAAGQGR